MKSLSGKSSGRAAAQSAVRSAARALGVGTRRATSVRSSNRYRAQRDVGPEVKFVDTNLSGNLLNAGTLSIAWVNGTVQGTGTTQRIGNKIRMTMVQYRLSVAATATELSAANYANATDNVRVALVYDKQSNGANPTVSQIWTTAAGVFDPFASRNLDYIDRYAVLADDVINLNAIRSGAELVERYLKVDLPVRYDASAGAVTDVETGGLFVIAYDQNATATNQADLVGRCRVQYVDM